ncbi:unnamed protein product [Candida verbasci]|uniref:General transcription and DNA repair factor IIH subunit TFB4 n=1 Tax=Candida verbasci TaxID=1227364 RepID=A0A9W4U0M7_9ASCO|nr:unnamed protein product [Candida verbasci]
MEAISDRLFNEHTTDNLQDDPSLLTIILDVSPSGWFKIQNVISIQDVVKSLIVYLNSHLSLNNSNQVAFLITSPLKSKFLYPKLDNSNIIKDSVSKDMYRQFKIVDDIILEELNQFLNEMIDKIENNKRSTLTGAISLGLTYTNRMLTLDQSILTTTASAMTTTSLANSNQNSSNITSSSSTSMKSRMLIISANDDDDELTYIPLMNCIFAAQKMKVSIDVAKLGFKNSSYLQQASDATNGIYLHIENPKGLIQVLSTAFFIEPNLRPFIILPANSNVNYRASCFITGKAVDIGYVCSVCLCIMSKLPEKCPACNSEFDKKIIEQLNRVPQIRKKRKLESNGNGNNENNNN